MNPDKLINLTKALYRVTDSLPDNEPLKYSLRAKSIKILSGFIGIFLDDSGNQDSLKKEKEISGLIKDIRVIRIYFEVAERQDWVRPENFLVLGKEYLKMENEIKEALDNIKKTVARKPKEVKGEKELMPEDSLADEKSKGEKRREKAGEDEGIKKEIKKAEKNKTEKSNLEKEKIKNERQRKILEVLRKKDQIQVKDLKKIFPSVSKRTLRRDFVYLLQAGMVVRKGKKNETVYMINSADRTG